MAADGGAARAIDTNEQRGAESSGNLPDGNSWRLYPLRQKGVVTGFILHVRVAPNVYKKARLPVADEGLDTPVKRKRFSAEAAPVIVDRYREELLSKPAPVPEAKAITFYDFAELWWSGKLHEQFPDHVKKKKSAAADEAKFVWAKTVMADVPLKDFTVDHAERLMRALPRDLSSATRRHYAQSIAKVVAYAVYPARIIERNPLPRGFLPKIGPRKAKGYLYPDEEASLVGCTKLGEDGAVLVPLHRRIYWAFLTREGCRETEAIELQWRDVDLKRGIVKLDENKTDDPRAWALDPGVVSALAVWKSMHPLRGEDGEVPGDARVFVDDAGLPISQAHLPDELRADLIAAGVTREELHKTTKSRRRLWVHDLRGTFVTIALANGKSETWVADRTGHRSSVMINTYRRTARSADEIGLGTLVPMNEAIPELRSKPEQPPPAPPEDDRSCTAPFSGPQSAPAAKSSGGGNASRSRSKMPSRPLGGMAYAGDLKSLAGNSVRVRVPQGLLTVIAGVPQGARPRG